MNFSSSQYRQAIKKASKMSKKQLERIAVNGKSIKDMTPEERAIVIKKVKQRADYSQIEKEIKKEVAPSGSPVIKD